MSTYSQRANAVDPLEYVTATPKNVPLLLLRLLQHKSPSGKEEIIRKIILKFLKKKAPDIFDSITQDEHGNMHVIVGGDKAKGMPCFTAHMDTVHRKEGLIDIKLTTGPKDVDKGYIVAYEEVRPFTQLNGVKTYKETVYKRSILGADDKTGCYILCNMISRKVPGLYCFFIEEECSGKNGSRGWVPAHTQLLKDLDIHQVISFDRKGLSDVINYQSKGDCASKEFVKELSVRLSTGINALTGGKHTFSGATGSFTDSANFGDVVSEITNLSVGYYDQHTTREKQDLEFLNLFLEVCCTVSWAGLPIKRKVGDWGYTYSPSRTNYTDWQDEYYGAVPARRFKHFDFWDMTKTLKENDVNLYRQRGAIAKTINNASFLTKEQTLAEEIHEMISGYEKITEAYKALIAVNKDHIESMPQEFIDQLRLVLPLLDRANEVLGVKTNRPVIKFNKEDRTCTVDGEAVPLLTKRGKAISPRHIIGVSPNTKLYVRVYKVLHLVHTVTQEEFDALIEKQAAALIAIQSASAKLLETSGDKGGKSIH